MARLSDDEGRPPDLDMATATTSSLFPAQPQVSLPLTHRAVLNKIFVSTLAALADIDIFSSGTTPTSFVVYAHDRDDGVDEGAGPAYSKVVKNFINWMSLARTRTYSDRYPSGTFAHEIRPNGDLTNRDILANQLCLLPRTDPAPAADSARCSRVETVIVFASPRLRSYCQHPFARGYIDMIKAVFEQCRGVSDEVLRQRLQDVVGTVRDELGFHHVLTEIAFLELRHRHNPGMHNIILVSFEKGIPDYLYFQESTTLRLSIDPSSSLEEMHGRFFKLMRMLYVTSHTAIDLYQRAYNDTRTEAGNSDSYISDGNLDHVFDKRISWAQRDLVKHGNSELRQLHEMAQLTKLGNEAYSDFKKRRDKILGSLATISYRDRKDRNTERIAGTCRWFTRHQKFHDWRKSDLGGILWVTAYPGCGKSVLLRHLIDTVLVAPSTAVCYFFFKDDFDDQKSVVGALRCLLHQMFRQRSELVTEKVVQKFEQDQQILTSASNLWDLLIDVAHSIDVGHIIIVIDALDECQPNDRRVFLEQLVRWHGVKSACRLKFLISSRLYSDISRGFHKAGSEIHLSGEEDFELNQISDEINLVIAHKLRDTAAFLDLSRDNQDLLHTELTRFEHKTYLWAHLVIDEIDQMDETHSRSLLQQVSSLPKTVNEAYEKILSRSRDRTKVMRMLSIIVAAAEPLNLVQLAQAWALMPDVQNREELEVASEDKMRRTVRGLCGLFVIVVEDKVYLLHQTAKEFLIPTMASSSIDREACASWRGSILPDEADFVMAQICLKYLAISTIPIWDFYWKNVHRPVVRSTTFECSCGRQRNAHDLNCFETYAIGYWHHHVKQCRGTGGHLLTDQAADLCGQLNKAFLNRGINERLVSVPGLTVASMLGLVAVAELLLQRDGADVERVDGTGATALAWAVYHGHIDVVRLLLGQRANPNTTAPTYPAKPLLVYALSQGEDEIAAMLLDSDADVNAADLEGATALMEAVMFWRGSADIVLRLVQRGADVDAVYYRRSADWYFGLGMGDTAFGMACLSGRPQRVRVLLEAGAYSGLANRSGKTPLMLWCSADSDADSDELTEITTILACQSGVEINACCFGDTALSFACRRGRLGQVQCLLKLGATVTAAAMTGVVESGSAAMLQLLLDVGGDVNAADDNGDTALTNAAREGRLDCVKTLLKANADIHHANRWGETALHVAIDHPDIVKLLVRHGADINHPTVFGTTPLIEAVRLREKEVVQWLLPEKADTECLETDRWTALSTAVASEYTDIAQILLDNGAHVNHASDKAQPALSVAVERGSTKLTRMLLDKGADSTRLDPRGQTALEIATRLGHSDIIDLLLHATPGSVSSPSASDGARKRKRRTH